MRLWTLHPCYLDARGLVAVWREGLLAQKVLQGATRGYKQHPQLTRFRSHKQPIDAIAAYLAGIANEATRRGYKFDVSKISTHNRTSQIDETKGQLLYEWEHLRAKLRVRAPKNYREAKSLAKPQAHPLFRIIPGEIRDWEKQKKCAALGAAGAQCRSWRVNLEAMNPGSG